MRYKPSLTTLRQMPGLYETEHTPFRDKLIHQHFLFGESDWYAAEFDGEDLFFGFAVLNGDFINAEWGYFSLTELDKINYFGFEVLCDPDWKPTPASDIERIKGAI